MESVFISGLGMIGSSLARSIRQGDDEVKIIGSDPDDANGQFMIQSGLIDQVLSFEQGVQQADVIFLCGPVDVIIEQIKELPTLNLKPGVVVTDVGSTKAKIMTAAKVLSDHNITFVGGHPMAGSHLTGAKSGRLDLFSQATYFLIPNNGMAGVEQIKRLLKTSRSKWRVVSIENHEQFVGAASHLPHVIASSLVQATNSSLKNTEVGLESAAGGFRDTTRIAAADPDMWTAIMLSNQEVILDQIDEFSKVLATIKQDIQAGNQTAIHNFFSKSQEIRQLIDQG